MSIITPTIFALSSLCALANIGQTSRPDHSQLQSLSSNQASRTGLFERMSAPAFVDRRPLRNLQKRPSDRQGQECCTSGIEGKIVLGPICPVITVPPSPNCEDKPYAAEMVAEFAPQGKGQGGVTKEVARFRSNSKGEFRIPLPPGTYLLKSANTSAAFPFTRPQAVKVEAGKFVTITIQFDTGIR